MTEEKLKEILEQFFADLRALLADTTEIQKEEGPLTKRALLELVSHEAIVLEAYKDSVNVWTWGVGVTNASGHRVFPRYKDNPTSIAKAIEIFKWLVHEKYLPAVQKAFDGVPLSEEQLAAALSFHYNTGAIGKASWVRSFKAGNISRAKQEFMNWRSPPEIIPRREKERDLFFEGRWSNKGTALVVPVSKPSYHPNFKKAKHVDISKEL